MQTDSPVPMPLPGTHEIEEFAPPEDYRAGSDTVEHELEHAPPHGGRPDEYFPHGEMHEVTGPDSIRLSVQSNGTAIPRQRTLNFIGPTVAADADNKRINVTVSSINLTGITTATWNPISLPTLTSDGVTVVVPGAALGDIVLVSFSIAIPLGMILSGAVASANNVLITLANHRADTVDVGSGTLSIRLLKP